MSLSAASLGRRTRIGNWMGGTVMEKNKAGGVLAPCQWGMEGQRTGLELKRRNVSLPRTARQTERHARARTHTRLIDTPPWGFSDAVHQEALFSCKP